MNSKYRKNPLTLLPGGADLTFFRKSGKKNVQSGIKYPIPYIQKVVKEETADPITMVLAGKEVLWMDNSFFETYR